MTVAVYGASGYTGRLVIAELHRRKIDTVLVGRDAERLHRTAADAGLSGAGLSGAAVRVVGLDDPAGLADAFGDADMVINCVAPFTSFGEPVVRAAISARAHYVDTSGEQSYVLRVFATFAREAERAGVTVLPMVNDGGFLADLLVARTASWVGDVGDVAVSHRTTGSPGLSRGSGRTALASRAEFLAGGVVYDGGAWRADVPVSRASVTFPGSDEPSPVVRFAMPEVATVPRHVRARRVEGFADAALADVFTRITPEMVERLPDGPEDTARRDARFLLVADVDGNEGRARGVVTGCDTYGTTAVVAVEAARRLAAGGVAPGVLAPAQAVDAADFLDALVPHDVSWFVADPVVGNR